LRTAAVATKTAKAIFMMLLLASNNNNVFFVCVYDVGEKQCNAMQCSTRICLCWNRWRQKIQYIRRLLVLYCTARTARTKLLDSIGAGGCGVDTKLVYTKHPAKDTDTPRMYCIPERASYSEDLLVI
jgi:hypothetical protein